jgi:hypothetical protein
MGLRDKLRCLERETEGKRMMLVCPECGEEFVAYGDVALECIAYGWSKESGEKGYRETPEDIKQLFEHEHGLETFVEKTSGLPFVDRRVTGLDLGGVVHDA